MNLKGTLSVLILQILAEGPRHGYGIAQEIKHLSRGLLDFREGTLYPTLHAHENRGWIRSSERVENRRRRRYYRLTARGARALDTERGHWKELSRAVDMILEEA
jgi:PadR family transcriptional regulator PadR